MNPFSILKYQIYLLQLENYELGRFWKLLHKKGYLKSSGPLRKQLVWTSKAKLIFMVALLVWAALSIIFINLNLYLAIVLAILMLLIFPVFYTLALVILWPIDFVAKQIVINKAKRLIRQKPALKIIGIAGSYGKTTMKTTLETVLSQKFNVLATPESINTPLGIAGWLLKNFKNSTEILIIEMGEHYKGDVKYLCQMLPPDLAIITGISEAHFERLGSLENTAATIFELAQNSRTETVLYLNSDDQNVMNFYDKYANDKKVEFYSKINPLIKNKSFDQERPAWLADIVGIGEIEIPFLADYIFADIQATILIAELLGLSHADIKKGLYEIRPVEHRLQPISGEGNVLVIDDSYNSNPAGVEEAIKVLGRFEGRRKLYITPGIVETGASNKRVHVEIGCKLAGVADIAILIRNSATPFIAEGLKESGFKEENIIWFNIYFRT
jgi:UDP-N-acetylmuramoyl-tripeptide--D-alanyl-D-alanine ligase